MTVRWLARALEQAAGSSAYIARDRPRAAASWRDGLIETADRISAFPEIGRTVPELGISEVREVLHADSRVIYLLAPSGPVIIAVWHVRRNLTKRTLRSWIREARAH